MKEKIRSKVSLMVQHFDSIPCCWPGYNRFKLFSNNQKWKVKY